MSPPRIVALPRDPSPYQELLYRELRARGCRVVYGASWTGSRTLDLLGLPLELLIRRLEGFTVLHLHWTFGFALTGSDRWPALRRLSRAWFGAVLGVARRLGYAIVWTAHNTLPHRPVFDDDAAARRTLIRHCRLVFAHSAAAVEELRRFGVALPRAEVVPHGPILPPGIESLAPPVPEPQPTVLFFGRVAAYKGVEELVRAPWAELGLRLVLAGDCAEPELAERLRAAARGRREITLRLGHVPEAAIADLFAGAWAIAYPFRTVTTSGSVLVGLASGRPVVLPDLPVFGDLPREAVLRYRPGPDGLAEALAGVAALSPPAAAAIGRAGRAAAVAHSWTELADLTLQAVVAARSPD